MRPTLLDTCALIWWTLDPDALSQKAKKLCAGFEQDGAFISAISVWEIGVKINNKKLDIGMPIKTYAKKLQEISFLTILPVDITVWLESLSLDWTHRDPVDRVIVASAQLNGCQIMTNDKDIVDFYRYSVS